MERLAKFTKNSCAGPGFCEKDHSWLVSQCFGFFNTCHIFEKSLRGARILRKRPSCFNFEPYIMQKLDFLSYDCGNRAHCHLENQLPALFATNRTPFTHWIQIIQRAEFKVNHRTFTHNLTPKKFGVKTMIRQWRDDACGNERSDLLWRPG